MDVSQLGAQSSFLGQGQSAGSNKKLGQDQFLKLLVAQMKNQDPINPMDGKEFASQLAQFNSVEQLVGVNKGVSSLKQTQEMMRTEMTNSMAASLTGKSVRALSNKVNLDAGGSVDINFELNNTAEDVEIIVKDAAGSTVRTESLNGGSNGANTWTWDGRNNDGRTVAEGQYSIEVKATNGDKGVKARMFTEGTANRIRFSGDGVLISVDGVEVPIGNVETVGIQSSSS
ncbi:flagellar hook assembly protein FlgD [Fodinibius saliphilus]|uniref:flagellar hook assembly protein FlgD n=1 Tax=Fodinibius saliphilus TaxID=1920650 RepID=UPI00110958F3|nr:flagellar hook capping FlgD N-terminal domain-containing protein [Fodinibius saliphilus]